MKDYEKLIKIVPLNLRPRLTFNKRIDKLHNKLDLVYIDGVYKNAMEEQERRNEQMKKSKNNRSFKKYKHGGGDDTGCIIIL
jgi:hypothetical protein